MMLDRQSTTVPNTSNVSALTSRMVMSFPWARVPNATLHVTSSPGMRWLVPVLFVLIEPSPAAADDAAVWELLRGDGQVVLMRHAVTTPGVGDPAGFRLYDCATARDLTAAARSAAK